MVQIVIRRAVLRQYRHQEGEETACVRVLSNVSSKGGCPNETTEEGEKDVESFWRGILAMRSACFDEGGEVLRGELALQKEQMQKEGRAKGELEERRR